MKKFSYICIAALIFFLCFKYAESYSLQRFALAPSVVYLKDGDGIFIYDPIKRISKSIYHCSDPDEAFFPEELVVHNDQVIFHTYKVAEKPDKINQNSTREFWMVTLTAGAPSLYSVLQVMSPEDGSASISIRENFQQKNMYSVFETFPKDFDLMPSPREDTFGNPQLQCLYKQLNDRCVFVGPAERGISDKVIYLWDFKNKSMKRVLDFPQKRMSLADGGGGFLFAYLLTQDEAVFLEVPEQTIPVSMIGLNQFRESVFKKVNLTTKEVVALLKFEGVPSYPKISADEKFVVFTMLKDNGADTKERQGEIWIKEIATGKKIKITTAGHSPVWVR